jgi:Ca2+-binding EF-hand superfamily protein
LISPQTSAAEKVKLAFLLCDLDASGGVTLDNLVEVLRLATGMNTQSGAGLEGDAGVANAAKPMADHSASTEPAFLQLTTSQLEGLFAKFDTNGDRVLNYEEFTEFLIGCPEVMQMSSALIQEKLSNAKLLQPLQESMDRIRKVRGSPSTRS